MLENVTSKQVENYPGRGIENTKIPPERLTEGGYPRVGYRVMRDDDRSTDKDGQPESLPLPLLCNHVI